MVMHNALELELQNFDFPKKKFLVHTHKSKITSYRQQRELTF